MIGMIRKYEIYSLTFCMRRIRLRQSGQDLRFVAQEWHVLRWPHGTSTVSAAPKQTTQLRFSEEVEDEQLSGLFEVCARSGASSRAIHKGNVAAEDKSSIKLLITSHSDDVRGFHSASSRQKHSPLMLMLLHVESTIMHASRVFLFSWPEPTPASTGATHTLGGSMG